MNIKELFLLLNDLPRKIVVDYELFNNWLSRIKYVKNDLLNDYDNIYVQYFYILIIELIKQGVPYTEHIKLSSNETSEGIEYLRLLNKHLKSLLNDFCRNEQEYIYYKRDSASHIFVTTYENRLENDKVITRKKGKNISSLRDSYYSVLQKYGSNDNFDKYFIKTISKRIDIMFVEIEELRQKYLTTAST